MCNGQTTAIRSKNENEKPEGLGDTPPTFHDAKWCLSTTHYTMVMPLSSTFYSFDVPALNAPDATASAVVAGCPVVDEKKIQEARRDEKALRGSPHELMATIRRIQVQLSMAEKPESDTLKLFAEEYLKASSAVHCEDTQKGSMLQDYETANDICCRAVYYAQKNHKVRQSNRSSLDSGGYLAPLHRDVPAMEDGGESLGAIPRFLEEGGVFPATISELEQMTPTQMGQLLTWYGLEQVTTQDENQNGLHGLIKVFVGLEDPLY